MVTAGFEWNGNEAWMKYQRVRIIHHHHYDYMLIGEYQHLRWHYWCLRFPWKERTCRAALTEQTFWLICYLQSAVESKWFAYNIENRTIFASREPSKCIKAWDEFQIVPQTIGLSTQPFSAAIAFDFNRTQAWGMTSQNFNVTAPIPTKMSAKFPWRKIDSCDENMG